MRERGTTAFNAFIATLAGILIVATATYLLLVATEAMTPEDLSPSGWLRDSLSDLRALSGNQETLAIIALAGLGVVGAFILLMQVLPAFARERRLYGTDANGNRIMLGNDSVQRVIDEAASEVTGVQGMKSSLRQGDGGLIVNSLAAVDPGTDVRVAATEIDHRVKTAVHDRLGLSVERVNMEFSYREPRRGGRFPWNRRGPRHRPEAGRA